MLIPIIIAVVSYAYHCTAGYLFCYRFQSQERMQNAKIGNADEKAREIIDDALKTAETKKNVKHFWKQRKSPSRQRMNLKKRQRNAELNCSVMRSVYFQKKKLWIRDLRQLSRAKPAFTAKEDSDEAAESAEVEELSRKRRYRN